MNIFGGSVDDGFEAFDGSIVNISDGSIGIDSGAFDGSVVNISGGFVDDEFASMGHVALPNIGGVKADSAAKARVDGWGAAIPRADTTGPAGRKYE